MTFKWRDYRQLAHKLVINNIELTEACFRSAISRAYYSALHHAIGHLVTTEDFVPDRHLSLHTEVINRFKNGSGQERQLIGAKLKRLQTHRVDADYHDKVPMSSPVQAGQIVDLSDKVVREIDDLSS